VFELVEECKLELSQSDVKRIVNQLPVADGLACLDYLLRYMWDAPTESELR
jgi:hypothetical protein